MTYARVHDQTVMADYFRAMEEIEGGQTAVFGSEPVIQNTLALLDKLGQDELSDGQRQILAELRLCLNHPATNSTETIVKEQPMQLPLVARPP